MQTDQLNELRRQLPLPPLLEELIALGLWIHPGSGAMRDAVPFITDPLQFLSSKEMMVFQTSALIFEDEEEDDSLLVYRGSVAGGRDLPWVDAEKTLNIIINKEPGDDVAIALDYRPGVQCPHVVGSDWSGKGYAWRKIASSFDEFAKRIHMSLS